MDVEILVHGVPDGQDYYGIKEEQTNMGLFYDNSIESVKYIVEIKKQGSSTYAYYSYLRYKGLIGAGGRPGSYFGVTLRIDKYYQDAIHIYNLLDMMFKRYIIGTLLTPSGDGYKYLVTNFATKASEIDKIQQAFIQLIQTTCVSSKFLDIDASFIHPVTAAPVGNIVDVSEGAILSSIKKYSKVVLSPEYEMNIEKEYKKKLQDEVDKGNNTISQKDKIIAEKDGTISSLNQSVMTCQNRISALEQELKRKDADIQQQRQKGDLSQSVARIKEPITALAEYFRVKDSQTDQPVKYGHKNYILGILSCILSAIVLALCAYSLFGTSNSSSGKVGKESPDLQSYVNNLTQQKNNLERVVKLKDDTIADLRAKASVATPNTNMIRLSIDISGYKNGKKLSPDAEYVVTVKKGSANYKSKGNWKLANAIIKKGKESDTQITIQPDGKGDVRLEYIPQDANCECSSRTLPIESKVIAAKGNDATPQISVSPSVKKVKDGENYTFTISGYSGEGEWRMDGFSQPANKKATEITIKAEKNSSSQGQAIISYYQSDGKTKVTSKTFDYEKEE